jgi:hypothetical protein
MAVSGLSGDKVASGCCRPKAAARSMSSILLSPRANVGSDVLLVMRRVRVSNSCSLVDQPRGLLTVSSGHHAILLNSEMKEIRA